MREPTPGTVGLEYQERREEGNNKGEKRWKKKRIEAQYVIWNSNGHVWTWGMAAERYLPTCVVSKWKSGGASVMV